MSYWLTGTGPGYPYWLGNNPQPLPYGSFARNQDQTVAGANVSTAIIYDTTVASSQIYYSGSRIYVSAIGIYRILYTVQVDTTSGGQQSVAIYIRKNGVDVPDSNSFFTIQNNGEVIAACEIILALVSGDYIEIIMRSSDANMTANYIAAGGTAPNTYPATPAIITNIQKIA